MNIHVGDTFKSNRGRGPLFARVIEIAEGVVWLERANNMSARRWVSFRLTLRYLASPNCGWRKVT